MKVSIFHQAGAHHAWLILSQSSNSWLMESVMLLAVRTKTCSCKVLCGTVWTSLSWSKLLVHPGQKQLCKTSYCNMNLKKGEWMNLVKLVCAMWSVCEGVGGHGFSSWASKFSWFYLVLVVPTPSLLLSFARTKSSLSLALVLLTYHPFWEGTGAIHQGHGQC